MSTRKNRRWSGPTPYFTGTPVDEGYRAAMNSPVVMGLHRLLRKIYEDPQVPLASTAEFEAVQDILAEFEAGLVVVPV